MKRIIYLNQIEFALYKLGWRLEGLGIRHNNKCLMWLGSKIAEVICKRLRIPKGSTIRVYDDEPYLNVEY